MRVMYALEDYDVITDVISLCHTNAGMNKFNYSLFHNRKNNSKLNLWSSLLTEKF